MMRPRVLLGDDHVMFCEALRSMLEPKFDIVGIVKDGYELVEAAERLHPDVIVADVSMPSLSGIGAARRLRKTLHSPKIIFLTMHADHVFAAEAFRLGAYGYVLKSRSCDELVAAIWDAIHGRLYMSPAMTGAVAGRARNPRDRAKCGAELTMRQREILQLIAEGKSTKEIASFANVSPRTVEFHKYRIMDIIGVHTIAELTRYAMNHGIA